LGEETNTEEEEKRQCSWKSLGLDKVSTGEKVLFGKMKHNRVWSGGKGNEVKHRFKEKRKKICG